jgi:SNF2 family DNA or RNA helicase
LPQVAAAVTSAVVAVVLFMSSGGLQNVPFIGSGLPPGSGPVTRTNITIVETRTKQLEACKAEIVRQTTFTRDVIARFEKENPVKKLNDKEAELRKMPAEHFGDWREGEIMECGDELACELIAPLVKEGMAAPEQKVKMPDAEKSFKDKMAWARDQVHLLRRLQKELTGRVRSLRFFESVRKAQRGMLEELVKTSYNYTPGQKSKDLALLSCCGHLGEINAVRKAANEQVCVMPTCRAVARPTCVVPLAELGSEEKEGSTVGAKLSSVVRLIKRIPADERVLVFVQFPELLQKCHDALADANIATAMLTGTPNKRSSIIEEFQCSELKKKSARVLLLNLRDESAAGANLTAANHAIFVHPLLVHSQVEYNSCDTQAVGRVRRYGQDKTVQLYRFVVDESIDSEIFLNRREDARALMDAATPNGEPHPM